MVIAAIFILYTLTVNNCVHCSREIADTVLDLSSTSDVILFAYMHINYPRVCGRRDAYIEFYAQYANWQLSVYSPICVCFDTIIPLCYYNVIYAVNHWLKLFLWLISIVFNFTLYLMKIPSYLKDIFTTIASSLPIIGFIGLYIFIHHKS